MRPAPFHAGERRAQARAGATDVAHWAAGFIQPTMSAAHRQFFAELPFLVLSGADAAGRSWVTLLDGPKGFVHASAPDALSLRHLPGPGDPLAAALRAGTPVGVLGIALEQRQRLRMNGHARPVEDGLEIHVDQSFGNCPQYIHPRRWRRSTPGAAPAARQSVALSAAQVARIRQADTVFLGTGDAVHGFDASHRGGAPGFVQVADATRLRLPDYAGNNFFNSIGNLVVAPEIGLVFVDFETGGLLHVTGTARVDWDPGDAADPGALRMIDVTVTGVIDRPGALGLRWSREDEDAQGLTVIGKTREASGITSFTLTSATAAPLAPFTPGQHLPVRLDLPGEAGPLERTYSLSGAAGTGVYRITVKRAPGGRVSGYLHDRVRVGDRLRAGRPSGGFEIPGGDNPLVLVSAGVGVTPMVGMLHALSAAPRARPVWVLHGARDGAHHALKEEVDGLIARGGFARQVFYSRPGPADRLGVDYDRAGRITAEDLLALRAGSEARYLICGPAGFLTTLRDGLEARGVPTDHILFESFGASA